MAEMDAAELRLRDRVHHAYDALAPSGPSTFRVLREVRTRAAERELIWRRRALIGVVGAAVAAVSVGSVQIVPRTIMQREQPESGVSYGLNQAKAMSGGSGADSAGSAAQMPARTVLPQPCTAADLAADVTTNLPSYGTGDVVNVSTTLSNRGRSACLPQAYSPSVFITDASGRYWQLCPEPGLTYAAPAGPLSVVAALSSGHSVSTACTWHTSYTAVPAGTYTVHATWSSNTTATTTVSVSPSTQAPLTDYQP